MKVLIGVLIFTISSMTFAKSVTKRRLDDLENRVSTLEQKVLALSGSQSTTGLKVKDVNNQIKQTELGRGVSSESTPSISKKKQAEIMNQVESFKKKQAESQKLLDELMNEDF